MKIKSVDVRLCQECDIGNHIVWNWLKIRCNNLVNYGVFVFSHSKDLLQTVLFCRQRKNLFQLCTIPATSLQIIFFFIQEIKVLSCGKWSYKWLIRIYFCIVINDIGLGGSHLLRHIGMCRSNGSLFHKKLQMWIPFSTKTSLIYGSVFPKFYKLGLYIEKNS